MRIKTPSHATVVAYVALFFAMSGTAVAATGGSFLLGRPNTATSTTTLTNGRGVPLSLRARGGYPPLAVNSTVKVAHLNSEYLNGLGSADVQRRVTGTCQSGYAVTGVDSAGGVTCTMLAPPPPAPAPAQSEDKGFAISDLQVSSDNAGDWHAVARITNTTSSTRSGSFTVTIFRSGSVVATVSGSVSSLAAGNANTVDFYSTKAYTAGAFTTTFQTDAAYAS